MTDKHPNELLDTADIHALLIAYDTAIERAYPLTSIRMNIETVRQLLTNTQKQESGKPTHWIYLVREMNNSALPWFYCQKDQYGYFKLNISPREYVPYPKAKVVGECEIEYQDRNEKEGNKPNLNDSMDE